MTLKEMVNEARRDIEYTYDGPVTLFVMIARAARLAASEKNTDEWQANNIVAEALYDCLDDAAFIKEHGVACNGT